MGLITNYNSTDNAEDVFHFPTSKKLLLIFTRNPEIGKCKTRLAITIGDENALEVYKLLLKHTKLISINITADKVVYYSEKIWENDLWDNSIYHKRLQQGKNLGERMLHAFEQGFKDGYEKIMIIGSDMYDIDQEDIENAFLTLNSNDFVLGPAQDGGYYLLGMKKMKSELFHNKAWGTNSVLEATLDDLKNERVQLLSEKNDIDIYDDIKHIDAFKPFTIVTKHD